MNERLFASPSGTDVFAACVDDAATCAVGHAGRPSRIALALSLSAAITGCADLTFYNKRVPLDGSSVIAMDVKQRVVLSQKLPPSKDLPEGSQYTVTCAEPSPDALTVLGTSGGLSFSATGAPGKAINLSASESESGAFVGLRTQSIQLLRDQLYRLCEGYAAGGVNEAEFKAMQRRFQSTVLGLLAIEQLTRPVVAGQALLTASAKASAGAGAGDVAVTAAQQRVDAQKTKVTEAQNNANTKTAAVDKDLSDIADNNNKITEASKDGAAPPDVLLTADKDLRDKLRMDKTDAENARRSAAQEELTLGEDQAALAEAKSRSSVSSAAGGQLGELARSNAASTDHLAQAVREIVNDINASYTRDECVEFLSRQASGGTANSIADLEKKLQEVRGRDPAQERSLALQSLRSAQLVCEEVITAALKDSELRLRTKLAEAEANLENARLESRKLVVAQRDGGKTSSDELVARDAGDKKSPAAAKRAMTRRKPGGKPTATAAPTPEASSVTGR